mmetsp:Transcript_19935/g.76457  ORF Transcript_19935/g.76457 Transcript_19935/m.76457 type:complete len:500 (-) Transcript_19935:50-1549(-)
MRWPLCEGWPTIDTDSRASALGSRPTPAAALPTRARASTRSKAVSAGFAQTRVRNRRTALSLARRPLGELACGLSGTAVPPRTAPGPLQATAAAAAGAARASWRGARHLLLPVLCRERLCKLVKQSTLQHVRDSVLGEADAVVRDSVLVPVVGADSLRPLAGTDLGAPRGRLGLGLLLARRLEDAGVQDLHRHCLILVLRPLVLAGDDCVGRDMSQSHGRVGGVHVLATRPAGAVRVDPDVRGANVDVHFVRLRHHRNCDSRGVNSAGGLCRRDPLDPVRAALPLERAVRPGPRHSCGNLLEPSRGRLRLLDDLPGPSLSGGEGAVHPRHVPHEQGGLVAPGASADFHDCVAVVGFVARSQQVCQRLVQLGGSLRHWPRVVLCHRHHLRGFGPRLAGKFVDHGPKIAQLLLGSGERIGRLDHPAHEIELARELRHRRRGDLALRKHVRQLAVSSAKLLQAGLGCPAGDAPKCAESAGSPQREHGGEPLEPGNGPCPPHH